LIHWQNNLDLLARPCRFGVKIMLICLHDYESMLLSQVDLLTGACGFARKTMLICLYVDLLAWPYSWLQLTLTLYSIDTPLLCGKMCRSRSASTFVPSDQDLH
jgi:hypothetical protein